MIGAEELLRLDVPDLHMEFRRARVGEMGGDNAYVYWEIPTARPLPRRLQGRLTGPVFLADRSLPGSGRRAPALADVDPSRGGAEGSSRGFPTECKVSCSPAPTSTP